MNSAVLILFKSGLCKACLVFLVLIGTKRETGASDARQYYRNDLRYFETYFFFSGKTMPKEIEIE